ncbi:unnamed protein product [Rotaria sordida]|uniref:Uncharacterized protein n=1 Tax=Rotaria sordida TaxID=392033 RepID=A0A819P5L9_9BILA|nr:unnamed protein product [Rotaria sordida]
MASWEQDLLPFLDELLSYTDEAFYNFVRNFVGVIEGDILEIQRIKNVRILLQIPDVFSFFQINNKDILNLKERACFIVDDSSYIVRSGIRSNLEQFIELLKNHYKPVTATNQIKGVNNCMCGLVKVNNGNTEYQSKSFVHVFVNNLMKNINRSSNNYQFDPIVNKFASAFHILAGHQAYEFVRINLPGSLPSITTLKNYNQNINLHLNEGEFRFDSLKKYLDLIDSNHVFVCEDSTSVVSSVSYDSKTNSFIGFSPKLVNGLPLINQFQTNNFNELQQWFQDFEKSKLVNANLVEPLINKNSSSIHSTPYIISAYGTNNKYLGIDILRKWVYIYNECKKKNIAVVGFSSDCEARYLKAVQISLVLQGTLPSSTLNTHLFSSQPCETTFRSARSLSGTFSSITNFSISQFLNKIEKISILNHFKSTEGDNVECPLKFPIHHKNQHKERTLSTISLSSSSTTINDIEKIIIKAYHEAEKLMDSLQLLQILRENDLNDIKKLNSFVFQQLDLKSTVDYCYFNEIDLQDSADDTNNNIQNDIENSETNVEVEAYGSDEDDPDDYHFITSKETFQGMKIFDKIDPMKKNNYFHIMINNKPKYLHKQTAARLLTTSKNCLSSDRLSRVQQTNKQK